jgi:hypothetical protein
VVFVVVVEAGLGLVIGERLKLGAGLEAVVRLDAEARLDVGAAVEFVVTTGAVALI